MADFNDCIYVRGDEVYFGINIFLLCGGFSLCDFSGDLATGTIWCWRIYAGSVAGGINGLYVVLFTTDYLVGSNSVELREKLKRLDCGYVLCYRVVGVWSETNNNC